MKILNCYAGIGGNRKLWNNVEVTAVEINPDIAEIYHDYYPNDTIIIGDAHDYILKHYHEFDFIWTSPPCPTHSKLRYLNDKKVYPDMTLYQEIIFLKHFAKCKYVVENVKSYYTPLIQPIELGRHYIWTNIEVNEQIKPKKGNIISMYGVKDFEREYGYDLSAYKLKYMQKRQVLRNCVDPEIGKIILDSIRGNHDKN